MTDVLDCLSTTSPPWTSKTSLPVSDLEEILNELKMKKGYVTVTLAGSQMKTLKGVFSEFAKVFEFPSYFGFNGDAFYDCLTDLSWFETTGFTVLILDADQLLAEDVHDKTWLMNLLEEICLEWSVAVEENNSWDRPAIPFHILLHTDNVD